MAQRSSEIGDEEAWDLADEDALEVGTSFLDLHREWSSRQAHFHTLGYRDGIEEGKKSTVQEGFEAGYAQGVEAGLNCGLARGWVGAFTALPQSIQNLLLDDTVREQVEDSQAALSSISSEKAMYLFYRNINRLDDVKDKAESNANDTAAEDLMKVGDVTKLNSRLDSSIDIEKLHVEVQSIMKSNGII